MTKAASFWLGLLIGGIVAGIAGFVIGLAGGGADTWIDFCMDDGAPEYIADAIAREASCS